MKKNDVDTDKISRGLGVEPRGRMRARGGYFGAMQAAAAALSKKADPPLARKLDELRESQRSWIVSQSGQDLTCRRCGEVHFSKPPITLDALLALAKAFRALHAGCS